LPPPDQTQISAEINRASTWPRNAVAAA
jgi:hypothetical protein